MAGIFKAYDIRGIYGSELTEAIAYRIGRAFATLYTPSSVAVGRDMRPHSQPLFEALAKGLNEHGANVIDLGLCSTPMTYFGIGTLKTDAGIMVTASHNPGQYNGMKPCRANAVPISGATGIAEIEKLVLSGHFAAPAAVPGKILAHPIAEGYAAFIRRYAHLRRPLKVAMDMANGMGIVEARALDGLFTMDKLFDTLDGTFPNHEANPLVEETYDSLRAHVKAGQYDFGVAFDGDADRAGFVDEKGEIISMDIITALIARDVLAQEKGVIFYDLRSSWAVREVIAEQGGTPMMSRVGHAFIKQQMRDTQALFAGELSGHYYFRDNFYTESSALAVLRVANIVSAAGCPLSELIKPIKRYFASGEINSEVHDTAAVLARINGDYRDGRRTDLDGISVEYPDWWFNVRLSNTEPLVRLNVEAKTAHLMQTKRDELLAKIRG
ncbi:MAG TPA: phosphomannomutase/phosphoglucomutase [Verrucomicrobia bacterium]|nr:phosphomannomutase/phosphoglucomutase [Verrucomicrobiota bacterium]